MACAGAAQGRAGGFPEEGECEREVKGVVGRGCPRLNARNLVDPRVLGKTGHDASCTPRTAERNELSPSERGKA